MMRQGDSARSGRLTVITLCVVFVARGLSYPLDAGIRFPVWIEDAGDEDVATVSRLTRDDLRVKLDGKKARVRSLIPPGGDLILLLVMDLVDELSRVDAAREALIQAVNELSPSEYVGVLRAQDGVRLILDPTPDREKLAKAIAGVEFSHVAGLLDSLGPVSRIAEQILRESSVRVSVVYITDAGIYDYRGDYTVPVINPSDQSDLSRRFRGTLIKEEISRNLAVLRNSRVPMFFLHLDRNRNPLDQIYQNGLARFAEATSGEVLFCNSAAEVRTFVDRVIGRATNFYNVTVEVPPRVRGRVRLHLETSEHLELTYPGTVEITKAGSRGEGL